jgi:hypothetical protein
MPAYRRPQTTAFAPGDIDGYELLERAFQGQRYKTLDDSALSRSRTLGRKTYPVPETYLESPSSEESESVGVGKEVEESPVSGLAGMLPIDSQPASLAERPASDRLATPPHLVRENSGLPPTPPTMANSDDLEPKEDSLAVDPQFADAVRNALHGQRSGVTTPSRQLPTPGPSPPGTTENLPAIPSHRPTHIHPLSASAHNLREYPSSKAESFHTAREDPNASQAHLPHIPSPEHVATPTMLQFSPSRPAGLGLGLAIVDDVSTTPKPERQEVAATSLAPPDSPQQRRRSRSPYQPFRSDSDFEKHISYISDENDQPSAEDLNNMIYKQIQEDNVKRHSIMSNGSNAVPAGIVIPSYSSKEHKLRRTTKAQSLRTVSGSEVAASPRRSLGSAPKQLRHKQAMPFKSLEASPVIESNTSARRVFSEPLREIRAVAEMAQMTEHYLKNGTYTKPLHGDSRKKVTVDTTVRQHSLRRSPRESRIENKISHQTPPPSPQLKQFVSTKERKLRQFSAELNLENNTHIRHSSTEMNGSILSSPRKSLDPRHLYPSTTPFSASQFSDRTDIEVCEAKGVTIYPHNNDSLLVVQNGSRPTSKDSETPDPEEITTHFPVPERDLIFGTLLPNGPKSAWDVVPKPGRHSTTQERAANGVPKPAMLNTAQERGEDATSMRAPNPTIHVDSPLTNPRTVPEPPAFKVIPPTPSEELDRQLASDEDSPSKGRPAGLHRRESLAQRARRYSESYIVQPLFGRSLSQRKHAHTNSEPEVRPNYLSPLWRPNYIWEGYDSDEDYDDMDGVPHDTLPAGGDTSNVEDRRNILPRNMSVRMPGFRGQGGFLLGNSLGLDRHGTNNRRHHVERKSSTGGLRTNSTGGYVGESRATSILRSKTSEEMLRQMAGKHGRVFTVPFTGGKKVRYVGGRKLREKMWKIREEKEERYRERRRQKLRAQIQHQR